MIVKRMIKTETDKFEIGDIISFKLTDGEKIKAMAVRETAEGMLFVTVDCLNEEQPMFKNPGGMGSMEINYFNSDLRHWLKNEVLAKFPEEIRSRMVGMPIGDEFDLLRIPTEKEIFGENPYGKEESDDVKRFKGMKKRRNRIAFDRSEKGVEKWQWYWLQNRVEDTAASFANVDSRGGAYYVLASGSLGVRPVFLLS